MKIYIASSWKNEKACLEVSQVLRAWGHVVDCFCDTSLDRYIFSFMELGDYSKLNAITALENPKVRRAFEEDKRWLDWADAVVLILPCGRSAHLEAGYAVGRGKKLFILGKFPEGELDVMYGFAHALVRSLDDLQSELQKLDKYLDRVYEPRAERRNLSGISLTNFEGFARYYSLGPLFRPGVEVDAVQINLEEGFKINVMGKEATGERGDWILFFEGRLFGIIGKHTFAAQFKPRKGSAG